MVNQERRIHSHAKTAIGTSAKHCHILILRDELWDVYQHITAVLHFINFYTLFMALACSIDSCHGILAVVIGLKVNEGIIHSGLGETDLIGAIGIGIGFEVSVCVVIVTIAATKNIIDTALNKFHIGRGCGNVSIVHLVFCVVTDTSDEARFTKYTSPQIVTTKDIVTNPGETTSISIGSVVLCLTTDISLGMS